MDKVRLAVRGLLLLILLPFIVAGAILCGVPVLIGFTAMWAWPREDHEDEIGIFFLWTVLAFFPWLFFLIYISPYLCEKGLTCW